MLKKINNLIDNIIVSSKLRDTLKHFSNTALTTERGLQKDTGRREIAEVILFFSYIEEEAKNNENLYNELLDKFFDLRPVKDYKVSVNISKKLAAKISELNKLNAEICLKVIDQNNANIQFLINTGFFPYGITMAQLYMIDGVLEWLI
jgi:cell shape-determining protein MreC